jgi:hypothetical protein
VPSIYDVPAIRTNLPPGLIGASSSWALETTLWRKFHGAILTATTQ